MRTKDRKMATAGTSESAAMAAPSANDAFERGVQALKAGKMEDAVQLLGQALQARVAVHGDDALECASAYYRYGCALFYRAQEESDVFGAPLQSTVAARDEGPSTAAAASADPAVAGQAPPSAAAAAPDDKGKGVAAPEPEAETEVNGVDDEGEDVNEEGGDGEAEAEGEEGDDMQLAWENLEVARAIYGRHAATHAAELADVHMLLADLATEQESFETALDDLRTALRLLTGTLQASDRRLAELRYKLCLTLQFLQRPEEALEEAAQAKAICAARLQAVQGSQEPAAAAEAADLASVQEELGEKEAELRAAVAELAATRDALRAAFSQVAGGLTGGAGPSAAPVPAPAAAAGTGVVDLGVVGRGKKRLNLAPLQPQAPAGGSQAKRSLDDLMGSGSTAPAFSFKQPAAADAPPAGAENKRPRTEQTADGKPAVAAEAKPAALPAFLQPSSVQAVYGASPSADKKDCASGT